MNKTLKNLTANSNEYKLFFCFAILFSTSCMTLHKGYISENLNEPISQAENLILKKTKLFHETDSITGIVKIKKEHHEQLSGDELNFLFENFNAQLGIDKCLQAIVRNDIKDGRIDNPQIVSTLFSSARNYEKFYRSNKFLAQTINRGDASLDIPKRILNKIHRYLRIIDHKEEYKLLLDTLLPQTVSKKQS